MFDWSSLPKVELHLHLDVSLSFEAARELDPTLTPAIYDRDFAGQAKFANLSEFLRRVPNILNLLQTERGLQTLTRDVFHQLARDRVIYAELRFAPLQHTMGGLKPHEVVRIVEAAADQASKATGVEARLILCTLRHFSAEQSMETVALVDQFRGSRVVGFDLAGAEADFPITPHVEAFTFAHDRRIPLTAHTGEARGAESVWETLRLLNPKRIGHGVRGIEDPALVAHLREAHIHLEMCPSSNIQLNVFPSYTDHSINALFQQNLSLGISTDSRTLTPITLTAEYDKLATAFDWRLGDFMKCNLEAIEAAFLPQAIKDGLKRQIRHAYERE
jgi:adenosine deaminase